MYNQYPTSEQDLKRTNMNHFKGTMNFSPFGTHFPGIHQFVSNTTSNQDNNTNRYHAISNSNTNQFNQNQILSKFRADDLNTNNLNKYNGHHAVTTTQYGTVSYNSSQLTTETKEQKMASTSASVYQPVSQTKDLLSQHSDLTQDLTALLQQTDTKRVLQNVNTSWQSLAAAPTSTVADYLSHLPASTLPLSLHHFLKYSAENIKKEATNVPNTDMSQLTSQLQSTTQTINLNNLTSSLLPSTTSIANIINQQQQLQQASTNNSNNHQSSNNNVQTNNQTQAQVSAASVVNTATTVSNNNTSANTNTNNNATTTTTLAKKKKKKKPPKDRKPRPKPGEIRLTTALDGSTLYMCPDCQVCYPERGILEQHMIGHNLERKFVCDVCNAALKRKDHLTRHKQSHNPERPFICTVCLKAFKRKEQLTLHVVIHSGEKRHVCPECSKGFYRKDHLRKHTRSHIARRVKAELSQGQPPSTNGSTSTTNTTTPTTNTNNNQTSTTSSNQAGQQLNQTNNIQNNQANNQQQHNNLQQQTHAQLQAQQIQNQLQQQIQQAQQLHAQLSQQLPGTQHNSGNQLQNHHGQLLGN